MKTIITTIILLLTGTIIAQTQPLISGTESFETWETAESGQLPEFWDGFNRIIMFGGSPVGEVACVEKDSLSPKEGNYSVKMWSKSIMGGPAVPGILTMGNLVIDWASQDGDITGGIPFVQKPDRFVGWYKYAPNGMDTAFVEVSFTENGTQVGQGSAYLTGTITGWTQFTVDLNFDAGANPDSMNVFFITSINQSSTPVGSLLQLDAVSFEFDNLGMNDSPEIPWMIYPNPAKDVLFIQSESNLEGTVEIIDASGRVCRTEFLNQLTTQIDISTLDSGIYRIVLISDEVKSSATIIVE